MHRLVCVLYLISVLALDYRISFVLRIALYILALNGGIFDSIVHG